MNKHRYLLLIILLSFLLIGSAWRTLATPNALTTKFAVSGGGGGNSAAGAFRIRSSIGQAVVGSSSNGNYTIGAGLWSDQGVYKVYMPTLLKTN